MRILILGNNYSALSFLKLFEKDKNNLVFSTIRTAKNYINYSTANDIIEFCEANDINFVLITDKNYIDLNLEEYLLEKNISVFSPTQEASEICVSKAYAKKFIYKNKIKTPKFMVFEKPHLAIEYFNSTSTPQAIKPENNSHQECTQFCETYSQAQKIVNNLFFTGNKKIIIEDYIEGKNINVFTISNGYEARIIGTSTKYQDDIAFFEPDFIDENLKNEIQNTIIDPTIKALLRQENEYIGVLGFNIILTSNNELYLIGYKNFFDDLNVDFYTKNANIDWLKVFNDCISGDIFLKHEFKSNNDYMLILRENEEINFISAKTKNNLKRYLKELNHDTNLYNEAEKLWKY